MPNKNSCYTPRRDQSLYQTVRAYLLILLTLAFPGCRGTNLTSGDVLELAHVVLSDIRGWWAEMQEPPIARVGGRRIVAPELLEMEKQSYSHSPSFPTPESRRTMLNALIQKELLMVIAEREGLSANALYYQRLTASRRNILLTLLEERFEAQDPITDDRLKAIYHDQYASSSHQFLGSHIVLKTQSEAEKARRLLAAGKTFDQVALKMSTERLSGDKGGRMPPFFLGKIEPSFQNAYSRLKPGQVSAVIKTSLGYEIIRRDGETTISFNQIRDSIRYRVMNEKLRDKIAEYQSLYDVYIDSKTLRSLPLAMPNKGLN
jgi:peptidyl-prolyl cis-trans isomerase C